MDTFTVHHGGRAWAIRVQVPIEHDQSVTPVPALYYTDAWWWDGLLEAHYRLARSVDRPPVPPLLLVGIGTHGSEADWHRARQRDLTPSPYRPTVPGLTMRTRTGVILDSASTGGAAAFAAMLDEALFPEVARRYRTVPEQRGYAGHSYGGLFGSWLLTVLPRRFDRVMLVSPSGYWNEFELIPALRRADLPPPSRLFLGVGLGELGIMRRTADSLEAVLTPRMGDHLRVTRYPEADHLTVLPRALLDGMVHLYGPGAR